MLLRAFKIRKLLLALLLVGAASLETALRACVALRARKRATPQIHTPLTFHAPRPRVSAADTVAQSKTYNFSVNGLFFDFHGISMKRSNSSGSSKLNGGLTGALRTTMLLAAMASTTSAIVTFNFPSSR